jgi:hypothetical protein
LSGKTVFFKLDASSFDAKAYPRGLSLYVHLIAKNAYQRSLEAEQLFLATDETKKEAIVDRRYTHKGVYTVQMAPHEFAAETYYIEYRNLLGRDVDFIVLFQLDEPQQKFLNLPVTVDGHEAEGDKLLYFFVDLAAARADAKAQPIAPAFFEARILTGIPQLAKNCAAEDDFVAQHVCERILVGEAVSDFWGTYFPACVAHDELRRGIALDCWPAAVEVGRLAAYSTGHNLFKAYAMCPENLCNDGCRHGILLSWVSNHWDDDAVDSDGREMVIGTESRTICAELDDMGESCFGGLGAGLFSVAANAASRDGVHPQTVFKTVWSECGEIVSGLEDAFRLTAQDWCIEGAFKHYAGAITANLSDADYASSFAALCDPALIDDSALLPKCHAAQGFSAAYRARGNVAAANRFCAQLAASEELQNTVHGGRDECLRSVLEFLDPEKLHKEAVAQCPIDDLYSVFVFNLSPDYSSSSPVTEPIVMRTLDWFNGTALWDGLVSQPDDELWWFAIDANEASAKIVFTVHSRDPRIPLTTAKPKPGATTAASPVDDVRAERTNARADAVRAKTETRVTGVYAGVTMAFVGLKLLLLLWLRKKLRGHGQ